MPALTSTWQQPLGSCVLLQPALALPSCRSASTAAVVHAKCLCLMQQAILSLVEEEVAF